MYVKLLKSTYIKWMYGLFGYNYRVATLSTFYLTVTEIRISSFKFARYNLGKF